MGIKTGLSTNNSIDNTRFIIEKYGLVFDGIVTRDDGIWKPNKEPILMLMQRLGSTPDTTVIIGDSDYDILSARDAGISCAILWRGKSLKHKPDFIIYSIRDVLDLL